MGKSVMTKTAIALLIASVAVFSFGCERKDRAVKKGGTVVKKDATPKVPEKTEEEITAESLGEAVNSPAHDFAPVISADGMTLYFTSTRPNGKGGQDIWYSKKEGPKWTAAFNMSELNTEFNEGLDSISANGDVIYFTSDNRPDTVGGSDIYVCRKTENGWTDTKNLASINTPANEANAGLSADGKKLFFVSDRDGGEGDFDIWVSELGEDGEWGAPVNLGDTVNTDRMESSVFLAPDGDTLYFSSSGHGGFGGADIFRSIYRDGRWGAPENLGNRINTTGNETYFTLPGSGDLAYMASTLLEGKGGYDIVAVPMPMVFEPKKIVIVTGKVTDEATGEPVEASLVVKYRPTRSDITAGQTRADGKYKLAFSPIEDVMLMVYKGDDRSIYPYYEPIELSMDKDVQVVELDIVKNADNKFVAGGSEKANP